jgi:hypothetical protein
MTYELINGKKREVISEKLITGYIKETNMQLRRRQKQNKPAPMYKYTAVKVK